MANNRLQFRHLDTPFETREAALNYIEALVDQSKTISGKFGEPLLGEPIVVKYIDNDVQQLILAIGAKEDGKYHVIDTAKIDADIQELSAATEEIKESTLRGVEINTKRNGTDPIDWVNGSGVTAVVKDNVAYFELTTDNILPPAGYEGKFIHHNHPLTEFIENFDGLKIVSATSEDTNVRDAYKLVTGEGEQLGETIKIYKDQTLKSVELVDEDDRGNKGQFLKMVYIVADGSETTVYVNISKLIVEAEFKDGLQVNAAGEVSIKIDDTSENFLTVSENGVKVAGVQDAIDAAKDAEQTRAEGVEQAIQDELDNTQTGAGLAADGSYVHDHPTHFIDEVNSLAEADHALDTAVFELSGATADIASGLQNAISIEQARAESVESTLQEEIDNERTRAITAEGGLNTTINNEIERAMNAENVLQDAISAEQTRAEAAEQTLQNQLNDEIANRESADSALSDRIDSLEGETLSGEGAILVEGDSDKVVSLRINSADKVLTQDNSGLLTNLTVGIAEEDDVTYIVLKGKNDAEISRVNANKFVTDGMIDRVEIVGNQLVIEWNTQAGKQTVYIPLSDIFNPENYYTKEDIDNGLNNYIFNHINAAEGNPEEAEHNLLKWYEDPNTGKKMYYASNNTADMVCWASGKTLDTILQELQNGSGSSGTDEYARQQIAAEIVNRQNADNAISAKTNEEIQRLEDKINALSGLTPSEIEEINQRLDEIESGLTNFYTKEEIDDMSEVISASLNDLNDRKANKSDVYTKEEVDDIVSHIDISGSTERIQEELNELSASTISEINKIENEITNLSGATESAISEINEKVDDLSGATQVIENKVNELSGATASEIDRLEGKIDVLSAATQGIESNLNELSAATESAISEINDNISELSGATQIIENNLNNLSGATKVIESNLAELSAATMGTFNGAEYVSSAKTIVFKHDNEVIDTIDATDFIKDGMVDNVFVSGSNLVIRFNTDAGKEDIEIPLEDLFDPSNYYNKTEIDNKVSEIESALSAETADRTAEDERLDNKIDAETERAITEETAIWSALTQEITERTLNDDEINEKLEEDEKVIAAALNDLNDRVEGIEDKVKGDIYTKEEIDELIADIDVSDQLDGLRQELNTSINNERSERQSADNTINSKLNQLSANTEYYVTYDFFNPKEEVVAAAINDLNDRIGELEESVTGSVYTKEEADNKFLTKEDWENDEFVISTSLNDLNSRIIELSGNSGQVDLSGYYTSGQTDAAIATAVETATANLVTSGDVAENFYTKDEIDNDGKVISAAMNDLNDRKANKTDVYTKDEVNALIPQNTVRSSSVGFIWSGSQADFNAITEKDSNTLYIITGTTS